jgi:hypothetical protein
MNSNFPEFKKIEMVVDGKLIESFLINDKEVEASTYYSLLEDNANIYADTPNKDKEKKKTKYKEIDRNAEDMDIKEQEAEYIQGILDLLKDNDEESFAILYDEFAYHYKLGYLVGQLDTNEAYAKAMKQNFRDVENQIDDLIEEYQGE